MCNTCGCSQTEHDHLHIVLPIKGITCKSCADRLERELNKLQGIHARVNLQEGSVSLLLHDKSAPLDEIKDCICTLGFQLK